MTNRGRTAFAAAVAAATITLSLLLSAGAGAGLTAVYELYDHDAVPIPNGHGAARMSFDLPSSTRHVGSVYPQFRVKHEQTRQLDLLVKGPAGTVLLSDGETHGANLGTGRCTQDRDSAAKTRFTDSASQSLASGSAPYVGDWLPHQPLAALTGGSPEGRWSLIVKDTNPHGNRGTLLCGLLVIALPP